LAVVTGVRVEVFVVFVEAGVVLVPLVRVVVVAPAVEAAVGTVLPLPERGVELPLVFLVAVFVLVVPLLLLVLVVVIATGGRDRGRLALDPLARLASRGFFGLSFCCCCWSPPVVGCVVPFCVGVGVDVEVAVGERDFLIGFSALSVPLALALAVRD
jgi:hypothetical protein